MIVVGLTGGIATGKSTTADLFRERDIAVFDADRSVHNHMSGAGPAVAEICAIFGEEVLREDGSIDRNLLGTMCLGMRWAVRNLSKYFIPSSPGNVRRF